MGSVSLSICKTVNMSQTVAVIGGGVAGIVASYMLQERYSVSLIEKGEYLGGHTNTIMVPSEYHGCDIPIDTGFIVCNNKNYPTFHRFLERLSVPVRDADMSFGVVDEVTGLQYGSRNINTLFAQRSNIASPYFLRFLLGIYHFWKKASEDVGSSDIDHLTLREYLARKKIHSSVIKDFIIPISAAIWSTPDGLMLDFPVGVFLAFFHNHGLLGYRNQPQWQTVVGGSHSYVKRFKEKFRGEVLLNTKVDSIIRNDEQTTVCFSDGTAKSFNKVIIATHADQVLPMLEDPTPWERERFSVWNYLPNKTYLHTDRSFLPSNKRAQASWNYYREHDFSAESNHFTITYHMNRLQGITSDTDYCVTLNPLRPIDSSFVIKEILYTHPQYTVASLQSQKELHKQFGEKNTWYCGSYFGFGFHEDAVKSAVAVAQKLGGEL